MSPIVESIKKRIKKVAGEKKITFKALSERMGMSTSSFHRMMRTNKISICALHRISLILEVPFASLVLTEETLQYWIGARRSGGVITMNGTGNNTGTIENQFIHIQAERFMMDSCNPEAWYQEKERLLRENQLLQDLVNSKDDLVKSKDILIKALRPDLFGPRLWICSIWFMEYLKMRTHHF